MSKLALTTPRQAVVSVLAGAVVSWGVLALYERVSAFPPVVPWTVPVLLGILGVAGILYALTIPKRLEERRIGPQEGMVAVVTGKALVICGAVLAGAHTVYVMKFLPSIDAANPLQRVLRGGGTLVASLVMAVAGSMIERRLRIQEPPDDAGVDQVDPSVA